MTAKSQYTDEDVMGMAGSGVSPSQLALRMGINVTNAAARLRRLADRGDLETFQKRNFTTANKCTHYRKVTK